MSGVFRIIESCEWKEEKDLLSTNVHCQTIQSVSKIIDFARRMPKREKWNSSLWILKR